MTSSSLRIKRLIITSMVVAITAGLVAIGLFKLGQYYASDILYQLVKQETNGKYRLSFSELEFDILEKKITINDIVLTPDSTKDWSTDNLLNRYALEFSSVVMNLESVSSLYLSRELLIENVRIVDPQIEMIRDEHAPKQSFSLQTGNLYQILSNYLKVLRIGYFELKNGEFEHSPSNFSLGNIDFMINDLLMNSASNSNENFYSQNIEIEITDQRFELSDSIHVITFDRFVLSTADSLLNFDNVVIKPIDESISVSDGLPGLSVYDIEVPKLRLRGVDYFSAYRKNELKMDELVLLDAIININDQTGIKPRTGVNKRNSLLVILNQIFDEVTVGKLRSLNTHLDIETDHKTISKIEDIQIQRADIVLYDFQLDSINSTFDITKKYFTDIDVIIKDYFSHLSTGFSSISFDLLQLSSFDSNLSFKDLELNNEAFRNDSIPAVTLIIPNLSLKGLNYEALLDQKLLIAEIELSRPNIELEQIAKRHRTFSKSLIPADLHAIVEDRFSIINVNHIDINDGQLNYAPSLKVNSISLAITDLLIDQATASWHDVFNEIDLNASEISYKDNSLDLYGDTLKIERKIDRLDFIDWRFDFKNERQVLTGDFKELQVHGIHLDSVLTTQKNSIDSLIVTDANVRASLHSSAEQEGALVNLKERYISISDSRFQIAIDSSSFYRAEITSAEITSGQDQHLYGLFSNIDVRSPNLGHDIQIDSVEVTSSGELGVNNINVSSKEDWPGTRIDGLFADLKLTGLNQSNFWDTKLLNGDSLKIKSSGLTISEGKTSQTARDSSLYQIRFNSGEIKFDDFTYQSKASKLLTALHIADIDLHLEDIHYPRLEENERSALFAENFKVKLSNIIPDLINQDSLTIGRLELAHGNKHLLIENSFYSNRDQNTTLTVPKVEASNLDINKLILDKELNADNIQMTGTGVSFPNPLAKKEERPDLPNITIDTIAVSLDQINLARLDDDKLDVNHIFDGIAEASIEGKHFYFPMHDSYQMEINDFDYDYPNSTLDLSEISFSSIMTAQAYSDQLTYQNDWFDVYSDQIQLHGMDIDQWVNSKQYQVRKAEIEGLDALIYRDKSVDLAPNQQKYLPQRMLKEVEAWVLMDTINISGDIRYQEKRSEFEEIGEISFNDINGNLYHATTVDSLFNRPMQLTAEGLLMGNGGFEVSVLFDMNSPFDQFVFIGEVNDMELSTMNRILRPSAGLNITSGTAKNIWFNVKANNQLARGQMKLRYNDLKVQILNPETHDTKGLGQGIKTFFANTFVLKRNNPTFLFLRNGKVFQERDPSRSIFHYWGKFLLSGAVSSVGIHKSRKAEKQYDKEFKR